MPNDTKNAILYCLMDLLNTKQLDNITVTELVERCGISRQAFYYHFSDLYGVVEWGFQQELEQLEALPPDQWRTTLERSVERLQANRAVLLNIYRAYERSYVEHGLRRWARPTIETKVRETAERYRVTEQQVGFVTDLCAQGLVDIILNWVGRGMPSSIVERMDDFFTIMDGCLDYMLERLSERRR